MEAIEARFEAVTTTEPRSAPLPSMPLSYDTIPPALPVTAPLRTKNSRTSMRSTRSRHPDEHDRRATIKPPPRSALPPIPFSSHLLSVETRPAPTSESSTIVTLEFAYSTDDQCKNDPVKLTLEMLKRGGGHLVGVIEEELSKRDKAGRGKSEQRDSLESERSGPGMTDDGETSEESELDSEYGLEALLRDEYLRSLMLPDSPSFLKDFPAPPPIPETFSINIPTTNKPRAQTRNQYAQQDKFPSPSSPFTARSIRTLPLNVPPRKAPLSISTAALPPPSPPKLKDGGGRLTEIRILLLRDSMPYHLIAQRLITGSFVNTALHGETNIAKKKKVEDEARWLGMTRLAEELGETSGERQLAPGSGGPGGPGLRHKKSGVLTGGQGYI